MILTPEQLAKRRYSIGGSDAGKIMRGEWADLWLEKLGRKESDDLSGVLAVQLGSWTEAFNAVWYQRLTGIEVINRGQECMHADNAWQTCTLDGRVNLACGLSVWEAKHVGGRESLETVVARYQPQIHHQMHVTGLGWAVLSILIGTDKFEYVEVERDEFYLAALLEREEEFWRHVVENIPPPDMPTVEAPVPREKLRTVDFSLNNEWASHAVDWLAHREAAKKFTTSEKGIKALMLADIGNGQGAGIQCKRDKAGKLKITEFANAAQ